MTPYFQHKNITLFHADCMDILPQMDDKLFPLAITDPPYFDGPGNLGYYGERTSPIGVHRKAYSVPNWKIPDAEYFKQLQRVSKHQIIWGINYFPITNLGPGRIIWDKCNGESSFSDAEIAYTSCHDSVRLFPYMWNGMCQGKSISEGRLQQGNKKLNEKRIHATQKPVALYHYLLINYAKPGFHIIDSHLGSGSIAIACLDMGHPLTAIEIDKQVLDKAVARIENYLKQPKWFKPVNTINL